MGRKLSGFILGCLLLQRFKLHAHHVKCFPMSWFRFLRACNNLRLNLDMFSNKQNETLLLERARKLSLPYCTANV